MTNMKYLKTTKGFHLKRKSPQGDLKQETYRKHPVLSYLPLSTAYGALFSLVLFGTNLASFIGHPLLSPWLSEFSAEETN